MTNISKTHSGKVLENQSLPYEPDAGSGTAEIIYFHQAGNWFLRYQRWVNEDGSYECWQNVYTASMDDFSSSVAKAHEDCEFCEADLCHTEAVCQNEQKRTAEAVEYLESLFK